MTMMSVSGWMFLLVPAHPGCPRQNPQSRKMVVCVSLMYWYERSWPVCLPCERWRYWGGWMSRRKLLSLILKHYCHLLIAKLSHNNWLLLRIHVMSFIVQPRWCFHIQLFIYAKNQHTIIDISEAIIRIEPHMEQAVMYWYQQPEVSPEEGLSFDVETSIKYVDFWL